MRFGKNLTYAETALKVRQIGEYCIRKRLTALENNEEVPHDILTLILQTVRELACVAVIIVILILLLMSVTEDSIDMEELLDDFVTFYAAGIKHFKNNCLIYLIIYTHYRSRNYS